MQAPNTLAIKAWVTVGGLGAVILQIIGMYLLGLPA